MCFYILYNYNNSLKIVITIITAHCFGLQLITIIITINHNPIIVVTTIVTTTATTSILTVDIITTIIIIVGTFQVVVANISLNFF